jgi:excinuclease UvrABC ATPase subunit
LAVVTGLSGSGKSLLAFDTICAEGQRRCMESLYLYSRVAKITPAIPSTAKARHNAGLRPEPNKQ